MEEVSEPPKPEISEVQEPASEFDPKTMRKTKPGLKRLVLTLSVLFSFVLGLISLSSSPNLSFITINLSFAVISMQVSLSYGNQWKFTAPLSHSAKLTPSQLSSIQVHCFFPVIFKLSSSASTPKPP